MSWESALIITTSFILRKNKGLQYDLSVKDSLDNASPL